MANRRAENVRRNIVTLAESDSGGFEEIAVEGSLVFGGRDRVV
ncbi:MAG: hypothetical protein ACYS8I_05490 [Planctomycetota bacterium]